MFLFRSQIHPIENKQNWFSKLPYAMKIMVHQLLDWLLRLTIASLSFAIDDGFPKRICGGKNQKQIFPILVVKPHLKKVRSLLGFTCFHFSPRHLPIQICNRQIQNVDFPHQGRGHKSPRQDNPNQKYWRKRRNFADKSLDIAVLP